MRIRGNKRGTPGYAKALGQESWGCLALLSEEYKMPAWWGRWQQLNAKFERVLNFDKISELYLESKSQPLKGLKQGIAQSDSHAQSHTGSDTGEGIEEHRPKVGEHRPKVGNHRPGSPLFANILQLE